MAYLPCEITMIILSYLRVKSLLRFKCVSNSWYLWISNPKFELSNNQQRERPIVMMMFKEYSKLTCPIRFINQQLTLEELNVPFMTRDIDHESYLGIINVLGSCHDLILINIDKPMYLWNPATQFYT
ncbi:hypothetical protein RDI58_017207 [Solanum bulbocastanum]|uniref:F-box domain-containing protein n=1 Tax=Solanum bulbocastanum TaxID=147425 RepID=A0AAN8T8E8_SOLBU